METIGWIDALPAGDRVRFDPSVRTAADLVGAPPARHPVRTPLWPVPVEPTTENLAAVTESAA